MDNPKEIRAFLASRRARLQPEQTGLAFFGANRRVPGLRREEVALLARISADYYIRIEKGHLAGVSESVLGAIARALQLDAAERTYLFNLARAASGMTAPHPPRHRDPQQVRPSLQRVLLALNTPAFIRNARLDLLATNHLGRWLYQPLFEAGDTPPNLARFRFLDPRAERFYPDWDDSVDAVVALLRTESGKDACAVSDLIGELSARSDLFRTRWAAHNVRLHHTGIKRFHHPVAGPLELAFDAMELPGDAGLTLTAYSAEPGSTSAERLGLLMQGRAAL